MLKGWNKRIAVKQSQATDWVSQFLRWSQLWKVSCLRHLKTRNHLLQWLCDAGDKIMLSQFHHYLSNKAKILHQRIMEPTNKIHLGKAATQSWNFMGHDICYVSFLIELCNEYYLCIKDILFPDSAIAPSMELHQQNCLIWSAFRIALYLWLIHMA